MHLVSPRASLRFSLRLWLCTLSHPEPHRQPGAVAGKWNKHVDAWDSLEDNEFFSLEGFVFAVGQMLRGIRHCSVSLPPNRFTPEFQIYKKYKDWEIRRWAFSFRGV